ncbi:DUF1488 family protein [Noviherbaspirillum denitrificans]|uniref:DUF1488 domain-containing protein n=1 Tax=Noviherbaspirillum denitrificans TaxID=1968433 RepID=A0A254T6F7_9BURK|nr:DUF1488 family protein [Noviherbaspirillum denitrificans]OWW18236.1 hypothetical protein AYR66_02425 [Noviherbaspirillum denitrificans]
MNYSSRLPHLSDDGIAFTVVVDSVARECLITLQALVTLSSFKSEDTDNDMMEIFHAYEPNINGVARRLAAAGVAGNPLVLRPETFSPPRTM